MLRLGAASVALAAGAAPAQIVGGAGTTVAGPASNTVVTTSTTSGQVALNRFSQFSQNAGETATMVLPTGTNRLINFVESSAQARIDGTVVSRLGSATGEVGGHMLFAAPGGLLIGQTGRINAGRLSVISANLSDTRRALLQGGTLREDALTSLLELPGSGGSIVVNGTISAPGGVELRGASVTIGTTGLVSAGAGAVEAFRAQGFLVVNTAELIPADRLVERDGKILLAGDTVTLAPVVPSRTDPGARLDARPVDYAAAEGVAAGTAAGGIDIAGKTITLGSGSRVDAWDEGTASPRGGAVTIAASDSAAAVPGLSSILAFPNSDAIVTLGGAVEGASVSVTAQATATTNRPEFDAPLLDYTALGADTLISNLLDLVGLQLRVAVADGEAKIDVTSGATVAARSGTLTIDALSKVDATATPAQLSAIPPDPGGKRPGGGFVYSQLDSTASVTVGDGAALTSSGATFVKARNEVLNTATAEATARGTDSFAATIAIGVSRVDATVNVGRTATIDAGGPVDILARNQGAFELNAAASVIDGGTAGGAVAIAYQDLTATTNMNGRIGDTMRPTDVLVRAESDTTRNIVTAGTAVATGFSDNIKLLLSDAVFDKVQSSLLSKFTDTNVVGKKPAAAPDNVTASLRGAGAASAAIGFHEATATLAPGASIKASGTTSVTSSIRDGVKLDPQATGDGVIRNSASAKVAPKRKRDGATNSFAVALSATWTDYTSAATIGEGATVDSAQLGVDANTQRIYTETWTPDDPSESPDGLLQGIKDLATNLVSKAGKDLGLSNGFFSSVAEARASAEETTPAPGQGGEGGNAFTGSINFSGLTADTRAWVDSRANLTLGNDRTLAGRPLLPALQVAGRTRLDGVHLAGPLGLSLGTSSDGTAAGGSLGLTVWLPTTIAGIGDGVVVRTPGSVLVDADTTVRSIFIVPASGSGGGVGISGTVAINAVDGSNRASISNAADIEAAGVTVGADSDLTLWAVAGSLALSDGGSGQGGASGAVGIGVAVNVGLLDTDAKVGDNNEDDDTAPTQARTPVTSGRIATPGDVTVAATTTGQIGAVGVAGTFTSSSKQKPEGSAEPKDEDFFSKIKAPFKKVDDGLKALKSGVTAAVEKIVSKTQEATDAIQDPAKKSSGGTGAPSSTFGVAGSATVSYSELTTTATTSGARILKTPAGPAGAVRVTALNDLDLVSVNGSAAISKSKAQSADKNRTISGAVGIQLTQNETTARIFDSIIDDKDRVEVGATTTGLRVAAGVSLSADIGKGGPGSTAVAGSVSYSDVRDTALAEVADSTLRASSGTAADHLSISALNGITIGSASGGIVIGGSTSAGAAVAVGNVQGSGDAKSAEAALRRSIVRGFDDVAVVAKNRAVVVGLGLMGTGNSDPEGKAFAGSGVVNNVDMDSLAEVVVADEGDDEPDVKVARSLIVQAGEGVTTVPFVAPQPGATAGRSTGGWRDRLDVTPAELDLDPSEAGIPAFTAGAKVFGIAGAVGVTTGGASNALGLSVVFNRIDNDQRARLVGQGSAPLLEAGSVKVSAQDDADILAIAAGLSVSQGQFSGLGSGTVNLITGSARAEMGQAGNRLDINVTDATKSAEVLGKTTGDIWSFAGAIAIATKGNAAGAAVAVNEIRTDTGATPGVSANMTNTDLRTGGTVRVATDASGEIRSLSGVGAVSGGNVALAGAASANRVGSETEARITNSTIDALNAGRPTVTVAAANTGRIDSAAVGLSASTNNAGGVGLAVNRIDPTVTAAIDGGTVTATSVGVDATSDARIRTASVGVAVSGKFAAAGAGSVNLIGTDVDARIARGAVVDASGSVAVEAQQLNSTDVLGGALGVGSTTGGIGATFAINRTDGHTTARIGLPDDAGRTSVRARGEGPGARVASGTLARDAGDAAQSGFGTVSNDTNGDGGADEPVDGPAAARRALAAFDGVAMNQTEVEVRGVAVNAASGHRVRSLAVGGGAGSYLGLSVTGNLNLVSGTTTAIIEKADVDARTDSTAGSVDVRSSTHAASATAMLAAAISGGASGSLSVAADAFKSTTSAVIAAANVQGRQAVNVLARGSNMVGSLVAGAAGGVAAIGAAGIGMDIDGTYSARIDSGSLVTAGRVGVNAESTTNVIGGALGIAIGGVGGGLGVVVINNDTTTEAVVGGEGSTGTQAATVDAQDVAIGADSALNLSAYGAALAGSSIVGVAGTGIVLLQDGTTRALVQNATVGLDGARGNSFALTADETLRLNGVSGSAGIGGVGFGAGLGVAVVVAKSDVLAEVLDSSVKAETATIKATSDAQVDNLLISLAGGTVGISASVSYIQFGTPTDDGGFFTDSNIGGGNGSNSSLDALGGTTANVSEVLANASTLTDDERAGLQGATSGVSDPTASVRRAKAHRVAASLRDTSAVDGRQTELSSGTVTIASDVGLRTVGRSPSAAAGIGAAAGTVNILRINTNGEASAGPGTLITGRDVSITARADERLAGAPDVEPDGSTLDLEYPVRPTRAAEGYSVLGSGGVVAAAVAYTDAKVAANLDALSLGRVQGDTLGTLTVAAEDKTEAGAQTLAAQVSVAGINGSVARAAKTSTVDADLGGDAQGFRTVTVRAGEQGRADALAASGSGGLIGTADASVATAINTATVRATVREGARVRADDRLDVIAESLPSAKASATGVAVSGGVAVGASVARAEAAPTVTAQVGEGADLRSIGSIGVTARLAGGSDDAPAIDAKTVAATGGYLAGANGTNTKAINNATVTARLGTDLNESASGAAVKLPGADVAVLAQRQTNQRAEGTGVAVGGALAIGAHLVESRTDGRVAASLGAVSSEQRAATGPGVVSVRAVSEDRVAGQTIAGSGGLAAGAAALTETVGSTDVTAEVSAQDLLASSFELSAVNRTRLAGGANAINAGAVGASGGETRNTVDGSTRATIGADSSIRATSFTISALSNPVLANGSDGYAAQGGSGGLLNGAGAAAYNGITQTTEVIVDDRARLIQRVAAGADRFRNDTGVRISAGSQFMGDQTVRLDAFGLIQVPLGKLETTAAFTNNVTLGAGALISADNGVGLGTFSTASHTGLAVTKVYGGASYGEAETATLLTSAQTTRLGAGARIETLGDVRLAAGADADGTTRNQFNLTANSEVFNYTAVPLNTEAGVSSNALASNLVRLDDGAQVRAGRDVTIAATRTGDGLAARGVGRNPYLELFGTQETSGRPRFIATGELEMTGATVEAGAFGNRSLRLTGTGSQIRAETTGIDLADADSLGFVALDLNDSVDVGAEVRAQLRDLRQRLRDGDSSVQGQIEVLEAIERAVRPGNLPSIVVDTIFAAGGDVLLDVDRITATGTSSLTARGKPTVAIDNQTDRSLLLNGAFVPFKAGGRIINSGSADPSSVANLAFREIDPDKTGEVTVVSGRQAALGNPVADVVLVGDINNIGGSVDISVARGNLIQLAAVEAASYAAEVPEGALIANTPDQDWQAQNPISLWYGRVSTPLSTVNNASGRVDGIGAEPGVELVASRLGDERGWSGAAQRLLWLQEGTGNNTSVVWLTNPAGRLYDRDNIFGPDGFPAIYPHASPTQGGVVWSRGTTYRPWRKTATAAGAGTPSTDTIDVQSLLINARWVNLSGSIVVGAPNARSVEITPQALAYVNETLARSPGKDRIEIPSVGRVGGGDRVLARTLAGGDRPVRVTYVVGAAGGPGYFEVEDITAGGGGFASITGRIANTNHAGTGSITVRNGLGDVRVDNRTTAELQLRDVDTGRSPVGTVIINDANTGVRTEYRHVRGEGITVTTSSGGLQTGRTVLTGDSTSYAPQAGSRYYWQESRTASRTTTLNSPNVNYPNETATAWTWGSSNPPTGGTFLRPSAEVGSAYSEEIRSTFDLWLNSAAQTFVFNSGNNQTQFNWTYIVPAAVDVTVASSIRADYAIGINFVGASTGSVNVRSSGNLTLAGRLSNPLGTTTLDAEGRITQAAGSALETADLTLRSRASIGSNDTPFQARLTGSTVDVDSISDVNLRFTGTEDTLVRRLVSQQGDVLLTSGGSILRAPDASTVQVSGRNITLTADRGAVGTEAAPIVTDLRPTTDANGGVAGGVLTVRARDGVAITEEAGDIRVATVEATAGDVRLQARAGAIVSAAPSGAVDPAEAARLAAVWDAADIRQSDAARADEVAIRATEGRFARDYAEYRDIVAYERLSASAGPLPDADATLRNGLRAGLTIRAQQQLGGDLRLIADVRSKANVDDSGRVSLTSAQADAFRTVAQARLGRRANATGALTVDQIRDAVQGYYDELTGRVGAVLGGVPADPTAPVATLTDAQLAAYLGQRRTALNAGFADLFGSSLPFDGTQDYALDIQPGTPLHERLTAGATWRDNWLDIVVSKNALTPVANTQFLTTTPQVIGRNVTLLASGAIGSSEAPVEFTVTPTTVLTDTQKALLIGAGPGDIVEAPAGANARLLTVTRDRLIQVRASGTVDARAGTTLFLGEQGDMTLARADARNAIRLVAGGDISGGNGSDPVIRTQSPGGTLRIEASGGSIGSAGTPLGTDVGALEVARAADDIFIVQRSTLRVGNVFAGDLASLRSVDGGIVSIFLDEDVLHLQARRFGFNAAGDIGALDNPLRIATAGEGVAATSGRGGVFLATPRGSGMTVDGAIGDRILLAGPGEIVVRGAVGARGQVRIATVEDLTIGGAGSLTGGVVDVTAADIVMAPAARLTSLAGAALRATGDLTARNLDVRGGLLAQANGSLVLVGGQVHGAGSLSGGSIDVRDLTFGSLVATASTDQSLVRVVSRGIVSLAGRGLALTDVSGTAVNLGNSGSAVLTDVQAAGVLSVAAGGDVTGLRLTAGDLQVVGRGVTLSTISAGSLDVEAGAELGIDDATVRGAAVLAAADGAATASRIAAGSLDLSAGRVVLSDATVTDDATLAATGALSAARLTAGAAQVSGAGVTLTTLDVGRLQASASASATLRDILARGDVGVAAAADLSLADTSASGAVTLAGGRLVAEAIDVGGALVLRGASLDVTGATVADAVAVSGGDVALTALAVGQLEVTATGGATLRRITARNDVAVSTTADLAVADLRGGALSLTTGRDLLLGGAIEGASLAATATRDLSLLAGTSLGGTDGDVGLQAGRALAAATGSRATARDITLAGERLGLAAGSSFVAGRDLVATATGSADLGALQAARSLRVGTGAGLRLAGAIDGGAVSIASGGASTALARLSGGSLGWTSDGDVRVAAPVTIAGAASLTSRGALLLDGRVAAGVLQLTAADGAVQGAAMQVTGRAAVDAAGYRMASGAVLQAGTLELTTRRDGIVLGRVTLGGSGSLASAGAISTNGDAAAGIMASGPAARLSLTAGSGIGSAAAPLAVAAAAIEAVARGGDVALRMTADGTLDAAASGALQVDAAALTVAGSSASATIAAAGSLRVTRLTTGTADLRSRSTVSIERLTSSGAVRLAGTSVDAALIERQGGDALDLSVTGIAPASMADAVTLRDVRVAGELRMPMLAARVASVTTNAIDIDVTGMTSDRAAFATPDTTLLVARVPRVEPSFGIQLFARVSEYAFRLSGRTLFSDTPVLTARAGTELLDSRGVAVRSIIDLEEGLLSALLRGANLPLPPKDDGEAAPISTSGGEAGVNIGEEAAAPIEQVEQPGQLD